MSLPDDPPPRLCHLRKWPEYQCYGFNLHSDAAKAGQYIGSIDKNSPADAAGLLKGDKIIEVNGMSIVSENHVQVVDRIKSNPNETKLLVVSPTAEEYYKARNIVVHSNMDNVIVCESPLTNPYLSDGVVLDDEYPLRLCLLHLWQDFPGYGFNVQGLEGRPGHFIGEIDQRSPAQMGGLKKNDKIIEVNGQDVTSKNHTEVVSVIRSGRNSVTLLVIDPETECYLASRGIELPSDLPHIVDRKGPQVNPYAKLQPVNGDHVDSASSPVLTKHQREEDDTSTLSSNHSGDSDHNGQRGDLLSTSSQEKMPHSPSATTQGSSLQFACSAKEARERMRKKKNVKDIGLSIKDKYEILQRL